MSKLRVRGTLTMLVLFAAVAVFPNVVEAPGLKQSNCKAAACGFKNTGMLIADGGDPQPSPIPIPRPPQTA